MAKIYDQASDQVRRVFDALLEKSRPELKSAGLRVDLLCVSFDDDDEGAPLKLGGYPCAAIVRITSAKERAAGRADAEITIDKAAYEKRTARQQEALLFHELWHLQLKTEKGAPQFDAGNRPELKMRMHDHQFGWFDEVAKRYGKDSYEVQQADAFRAKAGQMHFGWDLPGKTSKAKVTA